MIRKNQGSSWIQPIIKNNSVSTNGYTPELFVRKNRKWKNIGMNPSLKFKRGTVLRLKYKNTWEGCDRIVHLIVYHRYYDDDKKKWVKAKFIDREVANQESISPGRMLEIMSMKDQQFIVNMSAPYTKDGIPERLDAIETVTFHFKVCSPFFI